MFQQITDQFAIGDETTRGRLQTLAQQGYKMVIDLCTAEEGKAIPENEVKEAGLALKRVPVSTQSLNPVVVEQFIATAEQANGPVYARCASGRRAALMVFLTQATQHHWTNTQFFNHVEAAGFDCRSAPQLAAFAEDYLEKLQHTSGSEH
ncbi:MAG TPA: sulfur transferase domain-containing protein [Ktedonobacteraceae bacterium]|nr:sulfur transferase domain-containing protein [Ktedonobacteraceae bacterium]